MLASSAALNNALWLICMYSSASVCPVLGQYWKGVFYTTLSLFILFFTTWIGQSYLWVAFLLEKVESLLFQR